MNIIGTGHAVPNMVLTNDMLKELVDTSDEWITTRTGIHTRFVSTDEELVDLAIKASRNALENSGLAPEDIDFVFCSNVASNYVTPSMSTMVAGALKLSCPCIDINGACAGFVYALDLAEAYFRTHDVRNMLILCAEAVTQFVDWKQRETCVLFGDGAGAVVATKGNNLLATTVKTVPMKDVIIYRRRLEPTPFEKEGTNINSPMVLKGREVFRMAVNSSQADLHAVMDKAGVTPQQVDHFMLHQANQRIVDAIQEHLQLPKSKFPSNIGNHGNTSSASIPILLDEENRAGHLKDGDILAFSAFGAGFVSGAALLRWGN